MTTRAYSAHRDNKVRNRCRTALVMTAVILGAAGASALAQSSSQPSAGPQSAAAPALMQQPLAQQGLPMRDPLPGTDRCQPDLVSADALAGEAEVVEPGDRLKLSVFEILQQQDDKWGADRSRLQAPARGFQLRPELSGEFLVQQDGSITMPLFGAIRAAGTRSTALQRSLECTYLAVMGRQATVSVVGLAKRPIFVVGPVKNAGSFEYSPGMTVIQALAMAGGLDKQIADMGMSTELAREAEKLQQAVDRAVRNLARATVLAKEAGIAVPDTAQDLAALAGPLSTGALSDETGGRRLEQMSRQNQEKVLEATAKAELADAQARKVRLDGLKAAVALRRERVAAINKLAARGSASRPMVIQAQADLGEAEARLSETLSAIAQSEERAERSRQDLAQLRLQSNVTVQKDLTVARTEARKDLQETEGVVAVIKSLVRNQTNKAGTPDFVIVRRQGNAATTLQATETTSLKPGDVLQVVTAPRRNVAEPTN